MNLLNISKISKYFGDRHLFENASLSVDSKDKIGFVGANGVGKTTLFRILLGQEDYDTGEIFCSKNTKIGYMEQHIHADSSLDLYHEVLTVFAHLQAIEEEIAQVTLDIDIQNGDTEYNVKRLQNLNDAYEQGGGYTYKSNVRSALLGIGFSEEDFHKPFQTLSGGQKTRAALCKMLLSDANLLLFDEPTNHLDIASCEWLESFLTEYKGAFIVISHDRFFLDKVTNKTMELEHCALTLYKGNYSVYKKQKQENEKYIQNKYENTMREIRRIEDIIVQQKQWNRERNIKTAESKQKAVDRLYDTLVIPKEELQTIKPRFTVNTVGGNDVCAAEGLTKSFGSHLLFSDVNFLLRRGERVFLLGGNGCGKTTLFKIIMQNLRQDAGAVSVGANVEIGYYDQTQESLIPTNTLFQEISDAYPMLTNTQIRNGLAGFLFRGDDVNKEISTLSGGERARVMLLKLMLKSANFLLLDEPTNHLDIESREILEEALADYPGTIFAISHDRYFIDKLSRRILAFENQGLTSYIGNYTDYCEKQKIREQSEYETSCAVVGEAKLSYEEQKKQASENRKKKARIEKLEKEIEELEEKSKSLKSALNMPENTTDYVKCAEITTELEACESALEEKYVLWESENSEL